MEIDGEPVEHGVTHPSIDKMERTLYIYVMETVGVDDVLPFLVGVATEETDIIKLTIGEELFQGFLWYDEKTVFIEYRSHIRIVTATGGERYRNGVSDTVAIPVTGINETRLRTCLMGNTLSPIIRDIRYTERVPWSRGNVISVKTPRKLRSEAQQFVSGVDLRIAESEIRRLGGAT